MTNRTLNGVVAYLLTELTVVTSLDGLDETGI